MKVLYWATYWVVAYFTQLTTQAELTVQADGYSDASAECTLLWCSWTAREKRSGTWESGRAFCSPLLECRVTERGGAP